MSNQYSTTSSSLFLDNMKNNIPNWLDEMSIPVNNNQDNELNILQNDLVREAAFNAYPSVNRTNVSNELRDMSPDKNSSQLILLAKVELAKFLSGKHYTVQAKEVRGKLGNDIELDVEISNIPAKFIFKYNNKGSRLAQNNVFTIANIQNDTSQEAEYPWSAAGFREALDDLRTGHLKTADKAKTYQAYTITLSEVMKRYNGNIRQAMDRVKELLASQEIIGVGSNEFASVYAMDSLFPRLEKVGTVDNAPTFEFVKNIQHVAVKPYSSGEKLVTEAASKLKDLVEDFQIISSFRQDDNLIVNAKILNNGITKVAAFNFDISNDKLDQLNFVQSEGKKIDLTKQNNTDLFNTYQQRNISINNKVNQQIILTKSDIYNKLANVVDKSVIDQLIINWESRNLIWPITTDKFSSEYSFNDLLNQVDTKVLSEQEVKALLQLANKHESNFNRINQKDTGVRNDDEFAIIQQLRLSSLYNRLSQYLDNFTIIEVNDDVTKAILMNFSERGKEKIVVNATYKGNVLDKLKLLGSKVFTDSLKQYKLISKHNTFAKAIFSEKNLFSLLQPLFDNVSKVIELIKENFDLVDIGNGFFASKVPLSVILNYLDKQQLIKPKDEEARKLFLEKLNRNESNFNRVDQKDTGVRNDYELVSSNILRLASMYNYLSTKLDNFTLVGINDTAEQVTLNVDTEHGIEQLTITAQYKDNTLKKIQIPKLANNSIALGLYKKAFKINRPITAKSIFNINMLKTIYSSIFKDTDKAIQLTLDKFASPLQGNYYASSMPIASIIHKLSDNLEILTEEERNNLLNRSSKINDKIITAAYLKDSGHRNINQAIYSSSIRLANVHHALVRNNDKFKITSFNDDITQVELTTNNILGTSKQLYEIEYEVNTPKNIIHVSSFNPQNKTIIEQYQNVHGTQDVTNKAIFSKTMVKAALRPLVKKEQLDDAVNMVINSAVALGNDLFASDKSLVQLLNNIDYYHPEELDVDGNVYRINQKDTGIRDIIFDESLMSLINKASAYLNQKFKDFSLIDAKLDNNHLYYSAKLFDNNSGLVNNIDFNFEIDNGHIKNCNAIVNGKLVPVDEIYQVFAKNDILKKYLEFNSGEKHNGPIVISANQLNTRLKDILSSNQQINKIIDNWEQLGRIKKIASNAFVSDYTLECLLSMSNLMPLDDNILKARLNKKNSLYRVSATYIKDAPSRRLVNDWNDNRYIQFIREWLSKNYFNSKILDANLDDQHLIIKANIVQNGVRTICEFIWDLNDEGRPIKLTKNIPSTDELIKQYISRIPTPIPYHDKVIINIQALIQSLLGLIDRNTVNKALDDYINQGIITKISANQVASQYSISELILKMKQDNIINEQVSKNELVQAARVTSNHHLETVDSTVRPDISGKNELALNEAINKLIDNINIAADNKLITARKQNEWITALKNNVNTVGRVAREFKEYLSR